MQHSFANHQFWLGNDDERERLNHKQLLLLHTLGKCSESLRPRFSSPFWRKMLGHLPNLRYLKLSRGFMLDLASALSLTPHGYTENQGGDVDRGLDRVLAPALEEVLHLRAPLFHGILRITHCVFQCLRRTISPRAGTGRTAQRGNLQCFNGHAP